MTTAPEILKAFSSEGVKDDFEPGSQCDGEYVICPYCGETHGDCGEWVKENVEKMDCQSCGKTFVYWVNVSVDYSTEPIK